MDQSATPKPKLVDRAVGFRLKKARRAKCMTQADLSQTIDVTCEQLEKYEAGSERIPGSVLYQLADVLEKPSTWFYDDLQSLLDAEDCPSTDADYASCVQLMGKLQGTKYISVIRPMLEWAVEQAEG